MNGKFLKLNVNPKHRRTGDCAVRAVSAATGQDWYEAFDGLSALARKKASVPNDATIVGLYLEQNGFIKRSCKPEAGKNRQTVKELAGTLNKPALVRVANHFVAIDGKGNYVDTWDSGAKCAYTLWIKA